MKNMFLSLRNVIWAFEIMICLAALIVGIVFCSFQHYNPVVVPNVETHEVSAGQFDGIVESENIEDAFIYSGTGVNPADASTSTVTAENTGSTAESVGENG